MNESANFKFIINSFAIYPNLIFNFSNETWDRNEAEIK